MPKAIATKTIPTFAAAIARLREIAVEAGDHLLLGDGPPHPDAELLDLCAEIAQRKREADAATKTWVAGPHAWPGTPERVGDDARDAAMKAAGRRYSHLLCEAAKLPATTAQGIYAKALAIRASKTGAAGLAMSLADDLLGHPALRMSLWAADSMLVDPKPAGNIVALAVRSRAAGGRP